VEKGTERHRAMGILSLAGARLQGVRPLLLLLLRQWDPPILTGNGLLAHQIAPIKLYQKVIYLSV
jgi:hypothetical protein